MVLCFIPNYPLPHVTLRTATLSISSEAILCRHADAVPVTSRVLNFASGHLVVPNVPAAEAIGRA
jgi:hypothetical protein